MFDRIILDNSIQDLLIVSAIILLSTFIRKRLSRYIASLLFIPIHAKWKSVAKEDFTGLIIKPLGWFLNLFISLLALDSLTFPEKWSFHIFGHSFENIVHKIGLCLVIIFFIWVIQSFIDFIALVLDNSNRTVSDKRENQLIVFFRDFIKVIVYIIGFLLILKIGFRVDVGSVLTGLSIVGAALALAAKESIENLIASFVIFFDKPFFTGDSVKINNVTGTVEHIGLRSTRIRTVDQTLVTVPNKQMVDSIVDNWSMRTSRRAEIKLELNNSNDNTSIQRFIEDVNAFLQNKKPRIINHSVFMTDFNKSSTVITIEYFTEPFSMNEFLEMKQECNVFIRQNLEGNSIKMANAGSDINIFNGDGGGSQVKNNSII